MAKKLSIPTTRILLFIQHCIDTGKCIDNTDFLKNIDFNPVNMSSLKTGRQSLTVSQLAAAGRKYKLNINWVLGLESNMLRVKSKSAIANLKDAVRALEAELL